ncbi:MAG: type III pantothenate kinase [Chloroflexi bacterium]|nr:type III pantothenate kinase [Chloroflexota bacterium]
MLLAIDVGNTNVTAGWFRDGALAGSGRMPTDPRAGDRELEAQLRAILAAAGIDIAGVTGLVAASVVPALTTGLGSIAARRGLPLLVADATTVGIPIRVDRPLDVGADRLVNALAAARLHGTPAVVADFGTATTVDAVAADGAFAGGAIAPGLELGLDALAARTAQLPRVELRAPERAIARDTVTAIQSGAVLGYQALASGLLARIRSELAAEEGVAVTEVRTILTGGLSAAPWALGVEGVDVLDPDLTLKGLGILFAEAGHGAGHTVAEPMTTR